MNFKNTMAAKFLLITTSLLLLTACTQTQPRAGSGSPFIDALKKTGDIRETAEERKAAVEEVLDEDTKTSSTTESDAQ